MQVTTVLITFPIEINLQKASQDNFLANVVGSKENKGIRPVFRISAGCIICYYNSVLSQLLHFPEKGNLCFIKAASVKINSNGVSRIVPNFL